MTDKRPPLDFDAISQAANGNWVSSIFPAAGITFSKRPNAHQPCPLCGGSDRFRCDDKGGNGTWICAQCGAGNGFTLVKEFTRLDIYETNKLIAGALGLDATSKITDEQRQAWRAQQVEREATEKAAKRQARIDAAATAQRIWDDAPAADNAHPYLLRKKVLPINLRQDSRDNLLIPMHYYNAETQQKTLVNVQTIAADGEKRFLGGGLVSGAYYIIGSDAMFVGQIILLCEGFATGATIFDALSYSLPVIVAFNANNLLPVAQSLRAQYPDHRIIICADDDTATAIKMRDKDIADGKAPKPLDDYNTGIREAFAAAAAIGGEVVIPNFDNKAVA